MKIGRFSSESLLDLTQFIDQVLSPAPPRMSPIPGMSDEEQQGEEKRNFKTGRSWVANCPKQRRRRRRRWKGCKCNRSLKQVRQIAPRQRKRARQKVLARKIRESRGEYQILSARCWPERRNAAKMEQSRILSKGPPQLKRKGHIDAPQCWDRRSEIIILNICQAFWALDWRDHKSGDCLINFEIWSNKEKSVSTVPLPNWWLDNSR